MAPSNNVLAQRDHDIAQAQEAEATQEHKWQAESFCGGELETGVVLTRARHLSITFKSRDRISHPTFYYPLSSLSTTNTNQGSQSLGAFLHRCATQIEPVPFV